MVDTDRTMGQMQSCFHRFLKRQQSSSGEHNPETEAVKQYSWDQRRKDATQYIIENATSQELGRLPGQIDGETVKKELSSFLFMFVS